MISAVHKCQHYHERSHCLSHWHRAVHSKAALTHLHRLLQSFLHEHLMSSRQAWEASGSSASSWVQGARLVVILGEVHNTSWWWVTIIWVDSVLKLAVFKLKNENNSLLLSSLRRNSNQFLGTILKDSTRLRQPLPLVLHVYAFKLDVHIHPTQHLTFVHLVAALWCMARISWKHTQKMCLQCLVSQHVNYSCTI